MEANGGDTLILISNRLSYKSTVDLNIYEPSELESTFIEICNPKNTNIIIECIYNHQNMDIRVFNDDYLNELLDRFDELLKKTKQSSFLTIF